MTNDRRRSSGRTRIEKQAAQILDRETKPVELAGRLDFGYVQHNDRYADWHASTPLLPMVRALFLKEIAGYTTSELHRHLETNPDDAQVLGFEDVPARTTFGRTWRDRFDENLRQTIEHNARRIRETGSRAW